MWNVLNNKMYTIFQDIFAIQNNLSFFLLGGAKSFGCSYELTAAFKKGLMEAAKSTNAWIITGGTNDVRLKQIIEVSLQFRF